MIPFHMIAGTGFFLQYTKLQISFIPEIIFVSGISSWNMCKRSNPDVGAAHFLLTCPIYTLPRSELLNTISTTHPLHLSYFSLAVCTCIDRTKWHHFLLFSSFKHFFLFFNSKYPPAFFLCPPCFTSSSYCTFTSSFLQAFV